MDLPSGSCSEALALAGGSRGACVPLTSYPGPAPPPEYKCEFRPEVYRSVSCKVVMNIDPKFGLGMSSGKQTVRMDYKDRVCVLLGMGNAVYSFMVLTDWKIRAA